MGLVSSRSNNAEAQDLRHNFGGFTGAFHPMVGKLVGGQALGVKRVRLELAEECLAEALEDLRDGEAARLFDALVEIDKAPRELPREERTNGSLAGTHEAGERNNRHARSKAARSRCSCHAKEAR